MLSAYNELVLIARVLVVVDHGTDEACEDVMLLEDLDNLTMSH